MLGIPDGMWTSDLPDSFLVAATNFINSHSTGLIGVPAASENLPPHLVGSGTFIRIGSVYGILTAQHVVKTLRCVAALGIILVEGEQRVTEKTENLVLEYIAEPSFDGAGPDLGFILLSERLVRSIQDFQFKRFYDLDHHRDQMLSAPPRPDTGAWMVNGIPNELTNLEPSAGAFELALSFTSHCGLGGADQFTFDKGFDYVEVIADYGYNPHLPKSFGGISGGGVWFVSINWGDPEPIPADYIFVGMPIAETEQITHGIRRILCHGYRSIYEICYGYLVSRFS